MKIWNFKVRGSSFEPVARDVTYTAVYYNE